MILFSFDDVLPSGLLELYYCVLSLFLHHPDSREECNSLCCSPLMLFFLVGYWNYTIVSCYCLFIISSSPTSREGC